MSDLGPTSDLGQRDGPVLFFGGPYSNLQATDALLAEARRLNIPSENIICTGDVVAYCADAQATVDRLREAGITVIMGNCEESLGLDLDDCGCGFEDGSACDVLSVQWYAFARRMLDDDAKVWMRDLPRQALLNINGRRIALLHGSANSISGYVFASTPIADKEREIERLETHFGGPIDGVVGGHCGLPFTQRIGDKVWHNAGVIGMPANDGTPRVWYSLFRPIGDGGVEISQCPLEYDFAAAAAAMAAHNLPDAYAQTLANGLWPNMDILPEAERKVCGTSLTAHTLTWPAPSS